jgi:hypothetical protein
MYPANPRIALSTAFKREENRPSGQMFLVRQDRAIQLAFK